MNHTHTPAGMEGELDINGAQPNTITYAAAITACARMGDLDYALRLKQDLTDRCGRALCGWVGRLRGWGGDLSP